MRILGLIALGLLAACAPRGPAVNEQVIIDDRESTTAQYLGGYRVGGYLVDHFGRRTAGDYLVVSSAGAAPLGPETGGQAFEVALVVGRDTVCSGVPMQVFREGGKFHPATNQPGGLTDGYDAWVFEASCNEGK